MVSEKLLEVPISAQANVANVANVANEANVANVANVGPIVEDLAAKDRLESEGWFLE